MHLGQACEIAKRTVSATVALFIQSWSMFIRFTVNHTFLRTRKRGYSLRHQATNIVRSPDANGTLGVVYWGSAASPGVE